VGLYRVITDALLNTVNVKITGTLLDITPTEGRKKRLARTENRFTATHSKLTTCQLYSVMVTVTYNELTIVGLYRVITDALLNTVNVKITGTLLDITPTEGQKKSGGDYVKLHCSCDK